MRYTHTLGRDAHPPPATSRLATDDPGAFPAAAATCCALVALALATLLACGAPADSARSGQTVADHTASVRVRDQRVSVEIARTRAEQALGLGQRDALPWDHGMLFLYEEPRFYAFWMKGMRFDIDIVWIRAGHIVDISPRVPHVPCENGPTVRPRELADSVLEVPAGYAEAHGWRRGDRGKLSGS